MRTLMQLTTSSATLSMCGNYIEKEQILSLNFPFQRNVKVSPFNTFHGTQVEPGQMREAWAIYESPLSVDWGL